MKSCERRRNRFNRVKMFFCAYLKFFLLIFGILFFWLYYILDTVY